ncbi:hypothetical protein FMEXI_4452 [Fusarium mexicanum]|uniref:BZIP domain-containing protein n=1 Tax=Fusarium mexicanum TaxID=751941 RepID=A0A8H5J7V6_9HYPO|nr:hypothetical protein FMEXI_4452 [Fusarium mexicanum]
MLGQRPVATLATQRKTAASVYRMSKRPAIDEASTDSGRIAISVWNGLAEWRRPEDDWTGFSSWQERRKIQNRLSQRARRRRKKDQGNNSKPFEGVKDKDTIGLYTQSRQLAPSDQTYASCIQSANHVDVQSVESLLQLGDKDGYRILPHSDDRERTRQRQAKAYQDYTLNSPKLSFLHLLIRINALNALAQNAKRIGNPVHALCRDEFVSPLWAMGPLLPDHAVPLPTCPEILQPTVLQRTVSHHPWLDLLPLPRLRDNVLKALSFQDFDEDQLCEEVYHPEDNGEGTNRPALIVCGKADDIRGWKANVPFLKKWGWLLVGCPELLESTNAWRMQRREKTLDFSRWKLFNQVSQSCSLDEDQIFGKM